MNHQATYLVPYDCSVSSAVLLRLACHAAGARGEAVRVLAITLVHRALPLWNLPSYFDEKSWNALIHAETVAQGYEVAVEGRIRRSYDAGKCIVQEACAARAAAIFLALARPWFGWPRLDRTRRYVLQHAPCPVYLGVSAPRPDLEVPEVLA